MALNPIVYTEKVVGSFLRYQLTRFPFSDDRLYQQMRRLLRLEDTRETPLLKGPYVSLSRAFREGAAVEALVDEGGTPPLYAQSDSSSESVWASGEGHPIGLSQGILGNPDRHRQDREIREQLRAKGYEVFEIPATDLSDREAMRVIFYRLARVLLGRSEAQRLRDEPTWFETAVQAEVAGAGTRSAEASLQPAEVLPFEHVDIEQEEPYRTAIPLVSLKAAAGGFGESMEVEPEAWVRPNSSKRLGKGMFVAQVVGQSMEPRIPDGSYCIFQAPVIGSRTGRILLVEHRDIHDPETGGSYTVKEFDSSQVKGKDGQERTGTILLRPLNPDFSPIELTDVDESNVRVIAELVEVLPH